MSGYQYLPPLSDDEYAALKTDIANRGVLVPIEYDDEDNLIEGHHRYRAVKELRADGVSVPDPPRVTRHFDSEDDKIAHVLTMNLARRHLTSYQRTKLEVDLRERGWSFRRIAERVGVSVGTVHRDLSPVQSRTPARTTGRDGKSYARTSRKAMPKDDNRFRALKEGNARLSAAPGLQGEATSTPEPVGVPVVLTDVTPEPAYVPVRTVVVDGLDLPERVKRWLAAGVELVEDESDRSVVLEYRADAERLWRGLGRLLYPVRPVVKVHRGTRRRP